MEVMMKAFHREEECDRVGAREVSVPYDPSSQSPYMDNLYTTSIYNWYDFFPRAMLGQFRRTGNQYFLLMIIIMSIGTYTTIFQSPINPSTIGLPLLVVLLISVAQQGYADWLRHKDDDLINSKSASRILLDGSTAKVLWKDIQVGMLLGIQNREEVPADVVVLATSEDGGICYCETKAIDGETNLKRRSTPSGFSMATILSLGELTLECDPVGTREQASIHTFNGRLLERNSDVRSVTPANILLRGSVVRNTKRVVGAVVYTGYETKLAKNATKTPEKLSQMDKIINSAIYVVLLADVFLCVVSAISELAWEDDNASGAYYLGFFLDGESDPIFRNATVYPQYSSVEWQAGGEGFGPALLTFLVLYYNVLTISLYVTVEIVTRFMMVYIETDLEMYYEPFDMAAKARSTTVTDLGQIEYVFSDKTGTLTQNVMTFKGCSVNNHIYCDHDMNSSEETALSDRTLTQLGHEVMGDADARVLVEILALCHSVVVEKEDGDSVYQAESPDEGALVAMAKSIGFVLEKRDTRGLYITHRSSEDLTSDTGKEGKGDDSHMFFEELAVNSFDATRKRMSVLVRCPNGTIRLLVKGADSSMTRVSAAGPDSPKFKKLNEHLDLFAKQGLRTLVLGYRDLTEKEANLWLEEYHAASTAVARRGERLAEAAKNVEKDLRLVAATAIEDKLQEGVPDTIQTLLAAGIKFWVLTGDKTGTAIEIGKACGVLQPDMHMVTLLGGPERRVQWKLCQLYSAFVGHPRTSDCSLFRLKKSDLPRQVSSLLSRMNVLDESETKSNDRDGESVPLSELSSVVQSGAKIMFVMEGTALEFVMTNAALQAMLFEIASRCDGVLACRTTPKQKALLVETVQALVSPTPVTLAIGDGANDVSMIQKAQVGVGILGLEGQQAVNASDFAIAQFRFLKRLLLVHGRWNYRRMAVVILYSFYKNFVLVVTLFLFNLSAGYSGTPLFDQWLYSGYNFFTTLPVIALGIFEKDVPAEFALKHPQLYVVGRENLDMNILQIVKWVATAIVHGIIIYGIPFLQYPGATDDGLSQSFLIWGTAIFIALVIAMNIKILEDTRTVTVCGKDTLRLTSREGCKRWCSNFAGWTVFCWLFSLWFLFVVLLIYSTEPFAMAEIFGGGTFFGVGTETLGRPATWAFAFLIPVSTTLVDSIPWFFSFAFCPTPLMVSIENARGAHPDLEAMERPLLHE